MKKLILSLVAATVLVSGLALPVAAEGSISINEWFAANTREVSLGNGLEISQDAAVNLTTITGEFTKNKFGVTASYTLGTTDDYEPAFGTGDSDVAVRMMQIGGNYAVGDNVKLGAGYLTNSFDSLEVSGIYGQASGILPLGRSLALNGDVIFAPMLTAKQNRFEKDTTMTSIDFGISYDWNDFEISGGYHYQEFALDIFSVAGSTSFSGPYMKASYNF